MLRQCVCRLSSSVASTSASTLTTYEHVALRILPNYLSVEEQRVLLAGSLTLLGSPARTSSHSRKLKRQFTKSHPSYNVWTDGFMDDKAYDFERGHFDKVITNYNEMLVREGTWSRVVEQQAGSEDGQLLRKVLGKVYELLPDKNRVATASEEGVDPPSHVLMHLLHLGANGSIKPHVDNKEAFASRIVGVSLGGERIMRLKRVDDTESKEALEGPEQFDVLLRPGDAYVQSEPLRSHYTHEIFCKSDWHEREVGGTQRLSIMLRDKLQ
ncbi:hypothetical protein ACM66B_006388 [Microbotryomycetes sp. NB124-2]